MILASSSPRRAQLLETLGLSFEMRAPDIDETRRPDEEAGVYVERVARAKVAAILGPGELVLGADTAVVHGSRILGKPGHPEEARSMLRRLQGGTHEVVTGVAVGVVGAVPDLVSTVDTTEVRMVPMTEEEIVDYVGTGEPMGKAGAYALQERGGVFVEAVQGSPSTVIGLPVHLLPRLFARVGVDIRDMWQPSLT